MQRSTSQVEWAPPPRYPVSGWVEACLYVVAIAILSLAYVVGQQFGAHPIAFVLYAMLTSALVLLAVAGPGAHAREIMLAPQSWLVGAGSIGIEIVYFLLLAHISPALGSLVVRLAIPVSLLVGLLVFRRRPPNGVILGGVIVTAGILPLIWDVAPAERLLVFALGLASAAFFNLRGFSAEFHPWNRRAKTVMEKLRVTGLIVLVCSLVGFGFTTLCAVLVKAGVFGALALLPTPAQMLHPPTILLGCLVGSLILTAMAFLGFSSVVKITTENFTATTALTPIATLLAQWAASAMGIIPAYALDLRLLPAIAVVVGGVLLMVHAAQRR